MTKAAELAKMGEVLTNSQIGGRRNIIINGAMQVAQRGTSSTGIGASSGYFTLDRFRIATGSTAGRLTMAQTSVTDLPGFANALHLDCTTADTSIAAGEETSIRYRFEGQDLQQLKKGTSSAEKVTVSFYMKTNKAFTFMCELDDTDNNRVNTQQFTTSTSWTRHILTFVGDTTGTLDDDTARSMQLNFWIHAGSNFTGGTYSSNTWQSRASSDNMRAVGIGSFFDNTDNDIKLTGIQVEVGEQATPFEHRSFGEELSLCQRYFWQFGTGDPQYTPIGAGVSEGSFSNITMFYPTKMRAAPSIAYAGIQVFDGSTAVGVTGTRGSYIGLQSINFQPNHGSLVVGRGVYASLTGTSQYFSFDSEL